MTVREWFRFLRREFEVKDPDDEVRYLITALREGDWVRVEFFWLLWRSRYNVCVTGQHVWSPSVDGYWFECPCGARVPREIDEAEPSPAMFDVGNCQCKACLPCEGAM